MYPTSDISVFIQKNDGEFRRIVTHLCKILSFPGSPEDVVQDMYLKFLTSKIIQRFCPGFAGYHVQMSTYLFPIIKNFIISKLKSKEYRIVKQDPYCNSEGYGNIDDLDLIIRQNPIALDFQQNLLNNVTENCADGIGAEIREFEKNFTDSAQDKKYLFRKNVKGCSLSNIFRLLYEGYTNKEIADKLGVSSMSIINMKRKLASIMMKYGFGQKSEKNGKTEMPEMSV